MSAEFIRDICLSFPDVKEDIKWGSNLCFIINEKIFCITDLEGDFGVSFKVSDEEFGELTGRAGIIPAPYLARYKWIKADNINCFTKTDWKKYLKKSYEEKKIKAASVSKKKKK